MQSKIADKINCNIQNDQQFLTALLWYKGQYRHSSEDPGSN